MDEITIRPLSPGLCPALLEFFDRDAFTDNPKWASCYCYFNHAPHGTEDWEARTGERNRADADAAVRAGRMHGWLALVGGRPAGWVNANIKSAYTTLDPDSAGAGRVGAVVCFVVAPAHRGKGIAGRLLRAACDGFRERGLAAVEAYPLAGASGPAANHHGPLSMYLSAGFQRVGEKDGVITVRKLLG